MRTALIEALLALLVLGTWIGALGYSRLRAPFDRQHCVTFVNAVCGLLLVLLGFAADGPSDRAFKSLILAGISLLGGAALSHAVGRALLLRGEGER